MTVAAYVRDPNSVKDYKIDWQANGWLTGGDTITAATFTAPTGISISSSSFTPTTTTFFLTGGTVGVEYLIVVHITTAQGRQEDQTVIILCLET